MMVYFHQKALIGTYLHYTLLKLHLFSSGFDPEKFIEQELPLLIVGTKEVWSQLINSY